MRLELVPHLGLCRKCGRDAAGLDAEFLCEDCRVHRPAFDRGVSAMRFEGTARDLVNRYKFRRGLYLMKDLVDILEGAVRAHFKVEEIDSVLPMPSTILHRFLRGYNQCGYLAKELARRLGKKCRGRVIRRIGNPLRQGGLKEDDRRKNVIGTFAVRKPEAVAGKTVLVIDDVMTTGSTLAECAKTLKAAGARRVWVATLARSLHT